MRRRTYYSFRPRGDGLPPDMSPLADDDEEPVDEGDYDGRERGGAATPPPVMVDVAEHCLLNSQLVHPDLQHLKYRATRYLTDVNMEEPVGWDVLYPHIVMRPYEGHVEEQSEEEGENHAEEEDDEDENDQDRPHNNDSDDDDH